MKCPEGLFLLLKIPYGKPDWLTQCSTRPYLKVAGILDEILAKLSSSGPAFSFKFVVNPVKKDGDGY